MSTITAQTGTIARQFGSFSASIEIPVSGSSSLPTGTTTVKMGSMPVISQDFDVQEETGDLSELRTNISEVSIKLFDDLSNDQKLFSYINEIDANDDIKIVVTTPSGSDYFVATKSNCEYDWFSRQITIKARAAIRYDVEITSYDASSFITDGSGNADANLITSKDMIQAFLNSQGISPTTKILGHSFNISKSDINTIPADTSTRYLVFDSQYVDSYGEAQASVLRMTAVEGAITGTMMGYAFYVRRNFASTSDSDYYADISSSDIKSFGVFFDDRNVRSFESTLGFEDNIVLGGTQITTSVQDPNAVVNSQGTQDIDINYVVNDMNTIFFDVGVTNKWKLATSGSSALSQSEMDTISSNARSGYNSGLGIGVSYSIKATIFGISTIKPYQFLNFGSGIHPTISSKKVRPSYIEYDLENDEIKIEGYIIG